jgi:hypothetical protein
VKFRFINPQAVLRLIPPWIYDHMAVSRALEHILGKFKDCLPPNPNDAPPFKILMDLDKDDISLMHQDDAEDQDMNDMWAGTLTIDSTKRKIVLPIHQAFKGFTARNGVHSLYEHSWEMDEVPSKYFGITSRPWYIRFQEHFNAAKNGSPYLFHASMRHHSDQKLYTRVCATDISFSSAMRHEEVLVRLMGLYPLGLNMIPGGAAGIRYLSTLRVNLNSSEFRAEAIAEQMNRPSSEGRPNPLAAARWESDPDYAARVICGHSGRLTVEQVRSIRLMGIASRSAEEIQALSGARNLGQVKRVLSDRAYSRIAS